jgi:hypothetical protein
VNWSFEYGRARASYRSRRGKEKKRNGRVPIQFRSIDRDAGFQANRMWGRDLCAPLGSGVLIWLLCRPSGALNSASNGRPVHVNGCSAKVRSGFIRLEDSAAAMSYCTVVYSGVSFLICLHITAWICSCRNLEHKCRVRLDSYSRTATQRRH